MAVRSLSSAPRRSSSGVTLMVQVWQIHYYSTHEDTGDVMRSHWIVFPYLSLTSLKTPPVKTPVSWYRWFFTSVKQQRGEEILSS